MRLDLKPSSLVASAILALHAVAAACALLVLPGWPGALMAAGFAALGAMAAWRSGLLKAHDGVIALELEGSELAVILADGQRLLAEVAPRRYVGRYAVILPLRVRGYPALRRSLLVTQDMLGADLFRRLRIWALWGRLPAVAAKQLTA